MVLKGHSLSGKRSMVCSHLVRDPWSVAISDEWEHFQPLGGHPNVDHPFWYIVFLLQPRISRISRPPEIYFSSPSYGNIPKNWLIEVYFQKENDSDIQQSAT